MGSKDDLRELSVVVVARQTGLCTSETADLLRFLDPNISRVYRERKHGSILSCFNGSACSGDLMV